MSAWSEARATEALRLWNESRSATEIAKALASLDPHLGALSRNAVIGKLSRLGAPKRSEGAIKATRLADGRRGAVALRARANKPPPPPPPHRAQADAGFRPAAPSGARPEGDLRDLRTVSAHSVDLQLAELEAASCRYPLTGMGTDRPRLQGADTLFCGAAQAPDCPYCDAHRRLSWVRAA